MDNKNNWVEKFAKNVYKFIGDFAIPFTTPFFALYNCYKLMNSVENKYLRIMIFIVSMIYVVMSLALAVYVAFIRERN